MKRIAQFEKVSKERFIKDCLATFSSDIFDKAHVSCIYDDIKLPKMATSASASYELLSPNASSLDPRETILLPTGIRVKIEDGWVLKCYPRSGLGFKYRLQLNNTVGIIDSDYYGSDNE